MLMTTAVTTVAAAGLTALVRAAAWRWRVVDRPDGKRKFHHGRVPLWGGVAIYLALVLGLLVAMSLPSLAGPALRSLAAALIPAGGLACFFGALDDLWHFASRTKLALQFLAVLPVVAAGFWIDRIVAFGCPITLGWLGVPLTILWLLGCINALNLIDGMDGLASIVGLSAAAMMSIIAVSMGNNHVAVIALVLAGALAGFLVYNLPPASIFLGDSGSTMIGLVLGILGIQGAMKTSTTLAITAPAVIMTLPMFDVVMAVVRRKLTGRSYAAADRQHIHHRLLDRGLTAVAGVVHSRRGVPDHRGRGHGRHCVPLGRPGLDHGGEPGGADDPPAAVRPLRVFLGQRGDRPAAAGPGRPAGWPDRGRKPSRRLRAATTSLKSVRTMSGERRPESHGYRAGSGHGRDLHARAAVDSPAAGDAGRLGRRPGDAPDPGG